DNGSRVENSRAGECPGGRGSQDQRSRRRSRGNVGSVVFLDTYTTIVVRCGSAREVAADQFRCAGKYGAGTSLGRRRVTRLARWLLALLLFGAAAYPRVSRWREAQRVARLLERASMARSADAVAHAAAAVDPALLVRVAELG